MNENTLEALYGKIVAIIGPNGVGKSTQFKLLISFFKALGLRFDYFKSPNIDTESGKFIKKVMTDSDRRTKMGARAFQLYLADLFIKHETELQKRVERNKQNKVITAREDCSSCTEAWLRVHLGLSVDDHVPQGLIERMRAIPEADLVIILEGERHSDVYEKGHVHEANNGALDRYQEMIISLAQRKAYHFTNCIVINANGTPEEVHQRIVSALTEYALSLAA